MPKLNLINFETTNLRVRFKRRRTRALPEIGVSPLAPLISESPPKPLEFSPHEALERFRDPSRGKPESRAPLISFPVLGRALKVKLLEKDSIIRFINFQLLTMTYSTSQDRPN